MTDRPVSVIVVSRRRPRALRRCLIGLSQQDHRNFEVIAVADPETLAEIGDGWPIKTRSFDEANIAAARNAGLRLAGGDVVAFIDDDAVPEPSWLSRLTAVFDTSEIEAATGFVRGRNGISYQWRANQVDALGFDHPLEVDSEAISLHVGKPGLAIKTQGTNCAFRRATLLEMGGFDPGFHFYLDETDLNLRMAAKGWLTAVVPLAQVHHGYLESDRRRGDRVPLDLTEIGASVSLFLRKHARTGGIEAALAAHRQVQRARILRHLVDGSIEPREVEPLLDGFARGLALGRQRPTSGPAPIADRMPVFQPMPGTGPKGGKIIPAHLWQRRAAVRAAQAAATDQIVTLFRFSYTGLFHRMRFCDEGYWQQRGGVFGRSDRDGPIFHLTRFRTRCRDEAARISHFRPVRPLNGG